MLKSRLESGMATLSPEIAAGLVDLYGFACTEIACTRVLAGGRLDVPLDTHLPASADWYHASLRHRVVALDAAMADDDAACRAALIKAEALSEKSFDNAARIAEARQRNAILQLLTKKGVYENREQSVLSVDSLP